MVSIFSLQHSSFFLIRYGPSIGQSCHSGSPVKKDLLNGKIPRSCTSCCRWHCHSLSACRIHPYLSCLTTLNSVDIASRTKSSAYLLSFTCSQCLKSNFAASRDFLAISFLRRPSMPLILTPGNFADPAIYCTHIIPAHCSNTLFTTSSIF
ncbi:hypothetical protein V8G54_029569 [Vigna mungo]|uniref:Uncharacterized protein n=1 Tax=Vigna mungo TaxID=3915 RepID=A0AAQ3MUY7_VIGMU